LPGRVPPVQGRPKGGISILKKQGGTKVKQKKSWDRCLEREGRLYGGRNFLKKKNASYRVRTKIASTPALKGEGKKNGGIERKKRLRDNAQDNEWAGKTKPEIPVILPQKCPR